MRKKRNMTYADRYTIVGLPSSRLLLLLSLLIGPIVDVTCDNLYGFGKSNYDESGNANRKSVTYEPDRLGYLDVYGSMKNALIYRDEDLGETDLGSLKLRSDWDGSSPRGIYVDFIYDPNFYLELSVVKFMLEDILDRNDDMPYFYDTTRSPKSIKITVGVENLILLDEQTITLKPKLLKDILYNNNIFSRIYDFLYAFFQVTIRDSSRLPEYDRSINFKAYSEQFNDMLRTIDAESKTVCRKDELYGLYEGRLCVRADIRYINDASFGQITTKLYWRKMLSRVADFMNVMLNRTILVDADSGHSECYEIALRPELNNRAVLLFPHRAVKSALENENLEFSIANKARIAADIVLFKHRVLHALGVGHKYATPSIMSFYDKPWQTNNLFYIMPEDLKSLAQCYTNPRNWLVPTAYETTMPSHALSLGYVKTDAQDSTELLDLFILDYSRFRARYQAIGEQTA